ncbi:M23 family metallopeptidase [Roseovarius arcticus]|uniref:M23 family metallopeptidase n=1 Tax=Roseovarius arcticus TaxID=2547404 RepID=UPI001FE60717|nr:M23 family metallopeptidase [Roseovarius arcticus]
MGNDDSMTGQAAEGADMPTQADDAVTWTRVVDAGDSLSGLLAEAGLDTDASIEVTGAIGSEYDLRHLKPGHSIAVTISSDGLPRTATLEIEDGTRILATFGAAPSVQKVAPDLDSVRRAGEARIGSSIYAALDDAGIPTRFATDLELILAGAFDLRTALAGGEHIRLLWREYVSNGREVGEPTIDFAQLDVADGRYEILWPDDKSRRTRIFRNGQLVQTFVQPIRGARLSSAFGLRMHPIHDNMRMHNGVDFAAKQGAVVAATQSGKIAFMGKRRGYGLLVEIEHESSTRTLYAHLSAVNEALQVGRHVGAGTEIGRVGSTGTSTAPHLHYEIQVKGRPVSPLADTRLRGPGNDTQGAGEPLLRGGMQSELDRLLASRG